MPAPATPDPTTGAAELERRAIGAERIELRFAEGGSEQRTASGYAVLFDSETDIGGCWREVVKPGAFTRSLAEQEVVALNSHEMARVVGNTSSGTLRLRQDARGLAFDCDLPDTTDGRDLAVLIGRRDVAGMSFAFAATREEWDQSSEPPTRTIHEARLYEITFTAFPAYPDTSVGMRSLEHAREEKRQHNRAGARSRIAARRMRLALAERGI